MTADPACCKAVTTLDEVARLMVQNDCGEIPIVDFADQPIGVITDRDIVCRVVAQGMNPMAHTAEQYMSKPVVTVRTDARLDEVLDELDALWGDQVLVGHGVAFDIAVLDRARRDRRRPPLGNSALCTMRLAAALHPGWSEVTLESVASRLGVPVTGRHTARGDAVIAGAVMVTLVPQLTRRGHRSVGDALWLQGGVLL